jgi:transketolase
MRKTALNEIYKLAKKDKRVVFVGSDLGAGILDNFKKEMPERFFMEGISEQHLIGFISGLAMNGKIPYFNTIAVFLTRRCYEQVFIDACMHNLPIRLIGSGGGLVYAPLGPTHLAVDDIALMRAIPNMTIVACADEIQMKKLIPQTLNYPGPMYIRLAKGGDPIVTEKLPFQIGKAIEVVKGKKVLLLSTGITLQIALDALPLLAKKGIKPTVLHIPTIKPLDTKTVLSYAKSHSVVLTIEEAYLTGGLGSAVAELLLDSNLPKTPLLKRIGIPSVFIEKYGSQKDLLSYFYITPDRIVKELSQFFKI